MKMKIDNDHHSKDIYEAMRWMFENPGESLIDEEGNEWSYSPKNDFFYKIIPNLNTRWGMGITGVFNNRKLKFYQRT